MPSTLFAVAARLLMDAGLGVGPLMEADPFEQENFATLCIDVLAWTFHTGWCVAVQGAVFVPRRAANLLVARLEP